MPVCSDGEGCISGAEGRSFDLPARTGLRDATATLGWDFAVCTGPGVPYVAAMAQALDLLDSAVPCSTTRAPTGPSCTSNRWSRTPCGP
jgi:hypothetical protein